MSSKALGDNVPEILYWNGSWKALASTTSQSFQTPLVQGEAREEGKKKKKKINEINIQFHYSNIFH